MDRAATDNGASRDIKSAKDVRIFNLPHYFKQAMKRSFGSRLDWYEQQDEWVFRHEVLEQIVLWTGYNNNYTLSRR